MKTKGMTDSGIRWAVIDPDGTLCYRVHHGTREKARKMARFYNTVKGVQGEFLGRRRHRAVKVSVVMTVIGEG